MHERHSYLESQNLPPSWCARPEQKERERIAGDQRLKHIKFLQSSRLVRNREERFWTTQNESKHGNPAVRCGELQVKKRLHFFGIGIFFVAL